MQFLRRHGALEMTGQNCGILKSGVGTSVILRELRVSVAKDYATRFDFFLADFFIITETPDAVSALRGGFFPVCSKLCFNAAIKSTTGAILRGFSISVTSLPSSFA